MAVQCAASGQHLFAFACPIRDSATDACSATLWPMTVPRRASVTPAASKRLEKLSDQLSDEIDSAKDASEATTKEVQHARRTAETIKRDARLQQPPDDAKRKRRRSKDRYTKDGKSKAAVELGRKGGAARAKTQSVTVTAILNKIDSFTTI